MRKVKQLQMDVMDNGKFLGVLVLSIQDPNTEMYWTEKFLKRRGIFVQDSQKIDMKIFDKIMAVLEKCSDKTDQVKINKEMEIFERWIAAQVPEPII